MKCPCEECICIPICRHKHARDLFLQCSLIVKYEPNHGDPTRREKDKLYEIEKVINPTQWKLVFDPTFSTHKPLFKPAKGWHHE